MTVTGIVALAFLLLAISASALMVSIAMRHYARTMPLFGANATRIKRYMHMTGQIRRDIDQIRYDLAYEQRVVREMEQFLKSQRGYRQ